MLLKRLLFIILLLCLFSSTALAETYTVSPTGSHSDQGIINEALEKAAKDGGGTVYLRANGENNVFVIDGPIKIVSSNIILTGDPNVIVKVYSGPGNKQWYTGTNSIITSLYNDNIDIHGFQIDGSCDELKFEYHHSRADTAHDCERAIYIAGQTGKFCNNIKVYNMQIHDCFSDGIHIRFATAVQCSGNSISNCQHEGIFWTSVVNGLAENNQIAGITSDCFRTDNGVNNIIQNNNFFSYTGNSNNGAPKGWNNGIQVADAGSSKGYNASNKPTKTTNIEVRGNTFANTGTKAVWLDSTGKGYDNVYIHDNEFVNIKAVTNPGKSVKLDMEVSDIPTYTDITNEVQPSTEMSERIFSSIFDVFSLDVITKAGYNDTVILHEGVPQSPSEVQGTIKQYIQGNLSYTLVSVPTNGLSEVHYSANGTTAKHTLMVGEKHGNKVTFSNTSIWEGKITHQGNSIKINGLVDSKSIKVVCITPYGKEFQPSFKVIQIEQKSRLFRPILIFTGIICLICVIYCKFIIRHTY